MPLTVEEVTQQIDSFLQHVSQRYVLQVGQQEVVKNQLEYDLIKKEFKKIIFSEQRECIESIAKLPINLAIEAQQLRLSRIGAELDLCNTKYSNINSDCLDELSKALEFGNISENLKHKLVYVSLAYYLSYVESDTTKQQALKLFADTKSFLQQGNIPQFLVIDLEFLKLYYSFSILLKFLTFRNIEVHAVYNDLPLETRFYDNKFVHKIDCVIKAIPHMTWIDVQDKIAIVTAYSMISKSSYEKDEFCEQIQLEKAIDFVTAGVNKNMDIFTKELKSKDREQAGLARQAFIKEWQEKIKEMEEWIARDDAYWNAAQQQAISSINSAIAQAKHDAQSRAFGNTLKQAVGIAASCFMGPAACGVLGVSAGMATAVTSAAIGGATQAAITGGNFGDILKSAAIGGITGGVMSKVPVSGELAGAAKRIEGAKLGVLNSVASTGASTIVHGKGKLDPAAMLGAGLAGASGANMKGLTKDLTERVIKDTTATAIHGGKLIPNLANGAIESAAGYLGKTMGEDLKSKIEAERALSKSKLVLEEPSALQEGSEQENSARRKAKGKDRVEQGLSVDANGRFVNAEEIFSNPALISAMVDEAKLLVPSGTNPVLLRQAVEEQLKLCDVNELGNIGREIYNTDPKFRSYVDKRIGIDIKYTYKKDTVSLSDDYQLQQAGLGIINPYILACLAVVGMVVIHQIQPFKVPTVKTDFSDSVDTLEKRIHPETYKAKKEMVRLATDEASQQKNPDLCNALREKSTLQQAQHFVDTGYGIFQTVRDLYPESYKTKYPATGDGVGIHAATRFYGEVAVRECDIPGWDFERPAKNGVIGKEFAGVPGSVRHDMLFMQQSETKTFDIKTGGAQITSDEANKKLASLPEKPEPRIYEVRPNGVYPQEVIVNKNLPPRPPGP